LFCSGFLFALFPSFYNCWVLLLELGGEVLLEFAMALETVDRTDESRQIYAKLATVNWSQKIRRNSIQLMSGLDITKQLRKDLTPVKPAMDFENMKKISIALEKGLTNEWNDFKKDKKFKKSDAFKPWLDNEESKLDKVVNVNTLSEAYNLLIRELNPLKKVSSELLQKSFRKLYLASTAEKFQFSKEKQKQNTFSDDAFLCMEDSAKQKAKLLKLNTYNETKSFANGTWDLVLSLSDTVSASSFSSYKSLISKRFDMGSLRRSIDLYSGTDHGVSDTFPALWGLTTGKYFFDVQWNSVRNEMTFSGNSVINSISPWEKKFQRVQTVQV
jgi:hypothetical protein